MPENSHTSEVIARLCEVLNPSSEAWVAIGSIWQQAVQPRSLGFIFISLLAGLSCLLLKRESWTIRLSSILAVSGAPIGILIVAVVTYALGQSQDLTWWLGTSYSRITSTFDMLVLTGALFAAVNLIPLEERRKIVSKKQTKSRR